MDMPVLIASASALMSCIVLLTVLLRSRAESRRALAAALAETAELRRRLDTFSEQLERTVEAERARAIEAAYVITDAGDPRPEPNVPDRLVLTATVGEPLVKVVSFGHAVRRALSAESRNRIWFEMRREVRSSRRRRRREMKAFVRQARAERAAEDTSAA